MTIQSLALTQDRATPLRLFWLTALSMVLIVSQTLMAQARGVPGSFADLAEQISPAVVNITTSTTVARPTGPQGIVPEGSPFEDFFREFRDRNGEGNRPQRSSALGSGFVISEDGFIVTNNHVIEGADEITIEFFEGFELDAKLIGTDPNTDIALLKVEAETPLKYVNFGDSDVARVGDWVMAMGNPLGQGFSVSAGIVSARNRALSGSYDFMHLFGHVCLGLMWGMMAKASLEALANGAADVTFHETKLATGRYYMARRLPATSLHLARINSGAEPVMTLDAANF